MEPPTNVSGCGGLLARSLPQRLSFNGAAHERERMRRVTGYHRGRLGSFNGAAHERERMRRPSWETPVADPASMEPPTNVSGCARCRPVRDTANGFNGAAHERERMRVPCGPPPETAPGFNGAAHERERMP